MSNEILDLELDLTDVDTSFPTLQENTVLVRVINAEIVPTKKDNEDGSKKNLMMTYATVTENPSTSGDVIAPGYPLKEWYPLQQSDNPNAPDYKVGLAKLLEALFGERPQFNQATIDMMGGKEALALVKVRETEEFGKQNDVKRLIQIK